MVFCVFGVTTVFYMDLCIIILQLSNNFNFLYLCFYLYVKPAFNNCIISYISILTWSALLTELSLICMLSTCSIFYGL
jgi:hypothetical protein